MKTALFWILSGALVTAFAQNGEQPKFDAIAIHRISANGPIPGWRAGNGAIYGGTTLLNLIHLGWQTYEVEGAPAWATTDFYDVSAKGNSGASEAQFYSMVRSMLEDRFDLHVHWESQQRPGYVLELDKTAKARPTPSPPGAPVDGDGSVDRLKSGLETHGVTMASFTEFLSVAELRRPVHDGTGLTGGYDFQLSFEDPMRPTPGNADPSGLPSLFTALKSVGLRLTSGNVAVKVLKVDSVNRPSDN